MSKRNRSECAASLCVAIVLSAPDAFALDLSWRPQVRIGTRATDNVRWATNDQEAALGFDNGGGVVLKADTRSWKSTITPSFNFRRFAIGQDLDADEYGMKSQHQWAASERLVFGANIDYVRDSTLTTELSDAGAQNQVANRDAITVQPSISYLLDDRTTLTGSYLYNDVSFDTTANGQLVDFSYEQFSAGISHAWRDNIRLFLNGFASEFETAAPVGRTRTYGTQGGVEYFYAPDLGATLAFGYVKSDIEFQTQFLAIDPGPPPRLVVASRTDEASTNGPIASASLFKNFEHTQTRLDYNRRVSPSIRGSQQLEDDIQVTAEHDLTQEWRLGFRGSYTMRASELQSVNVFTNQTITNQLNRDQAVVAGWFTYAFTKEISVRAEYRFARNSLAQAPQRDPVYNNAMFVTFLYNGPPHFVRGF